MSRPLHVLILGGSPDHPGGVEAFCDRAAAALRKHRGAKVSVVTTRTAFLSFSRLPAYVLSLARLAFRRDRADCVWLQFVNLPDLGYLLVAKLAGMRVVVTPHLGSNWRSQSVPLLRRLSATLLGLANRIALLSRTQETEIALPQGVPRSRIRTFLPELSLVHPVSESNVTSPSLRLLHSSRLSEGKGTFLFVEVCARLRDAGVTCSGRIAGGTDEATFAQLKALIAARGLEGQVLLLGRLPIEGVLQEMRQSDVLVHLSRIDSYPLVVLEAMACATLPICIDLAGVRDMIETYDGHIVPEATALDETVKLLRETDPEILRHRGAAIAEQVRDDYGWDQAAALLEEALHSVVVPSIGGTSSARENG
jgi:glycosyltransferase involved in cell wall biosynthesis